MTRRRTFLTWIVVAAIVFVAAVVVCGIATAAASPYMPVFPSFGAEGGSVVSTKEQYDAIVFPARVGRAAAGVALASVITAVAIAVRWRSKPRRSDAAA
ncbi:hypothetical protein [Frondihabitans cladoniiphilus]|uniref:Uncharacterized protein n=1 Tax=Frondihabitans cladoniiphilus TaxID=715785 RepID=A0ABP8VZI1_9MICO